jgi:hypothetical protein
MSTRADRSPVSPFATDFCYVVGVDLEAGTQQELDELNGFYDGTHLGEVVSLNPGFLSGGRFALLAPDARGDLGPHYMTAYSIRDGDSAKAYVDRALGDAEGRPVFSVKPPLWPDRLNTRWRILYRRVYETGRAMTPPGALHIVGMDAPEGSSDSELAEFDHFYTHVHLPEVTRYYGFDRGSRWELESSIVHPQPGAPRFVAVYEAGAALAEEFARDPEPVGLVKKDDNTPSPFTEGPAVWQRRRTAWRLRYVSLGAEARSSAEYSHEGARDDDR